MIYLLPVLLYTTTACISGMTGYAGFVEVRNLGESGTLADMFTQGDRERDRARQ